MYRNSSIIRSFKRYRRKNIYLLRKIRGKHFKNYFLSSNITGMHVKTYFLKFKKYGILNYTTKKSLTPEINLSGLILKIYTCNLGLQQILRQQTLYSLSRCCISRRVRKTAKSDYCFVTSVSLSVRMESVPTRRIFMKFDMSIFRKN